MRSTIVSVNYVSTLFTQTITRLMYCTQHGSIALMNYCDRHVFHHHIGGPQESTRPNIVKEQKMASNTTHHRVCVRQAFYRIRWQLSIGSN